MPLYEYACIDCGTHFDALRPMKDADAVIGCKQCRGTNTRRLLSVICIKSSEQSITSGGGCSGCNGGSCAQCHH